jgi:hypothetical protein
MLVSLVFHFKYTGECSDHTDLKRTMYIGAKCKLCQCTVYIMFGVWEEDWQEQEGMESTKKENSRFFIGIMFLFTQPLINCTKSTQEITCFSLLFIKLKKQWILHVDSGVPQLLFQLWALYWQNLSCYLYHCCECSFLQHLSDAFYKTERALLTSSVWCAVMTAFHVNILTNFCGNP